MRCRRLCGIYLLYGGQLVAPDSVRVMTDLFNNAYGLGTMRLPVLHESPAQAAS